MNINTCVAMGHRDEALRGQYALGRVLEGQQGRQLCAESEVALRELGIVEPLRDLAGHFPELFRAD